VVVRSRSSRTAALGLAAENRPFVAGGAIAAAETAGFSRPSSPGYENEALKTEL
jgi:hypothetical protein